MILWSVYHIITGVITTPIVSYIPPVVWYAHFILFYQVTLFLIIVGGLNSENTHSTSKTLHAVAKK